MSSRLFDQQRSSLAHDYKSLEAAQRKLQPSKGNPCSSDLCIEFQILFRITFGHVLHSEAQCNNRKSSGRIT
jgi:hypothetical protein